MKFLAVILVLFAFYSVYSAKQPAKPEPVLVHTSPRPGELSDVEKEYYIKLFDYVMENVKANEEYGWNSSDTNSGKIIAGEVFQSKSSATCRPFSESFTIANYKGNYTGIACKRNGSDGWCRLKQTDAKTCALEGPASIVNYNFPGMSYGGVSTPNVTINTGGGIGAVGTPSVNAPGFESGNSGSSNSKPGQGYADTVTGTAGNAAGPATSGGIKWFKDTFR